MPRKTDGIASRMSGMVITGGDSWIFVPDLLRAAERAPEGQAHQPEHVERGQAGHDEADRPDPDEAELERLAEDLVLREEAGQRRDPAIASEPMSIVT